MTTQQVARWNNAFRAALNMSDENMSDDDRMLVVRLRDNGRSAAYAAARVRIRVQRRARMVLAGW